MISIEKDLHRYANDMGIELNEFQTSQFQTYMELLLEWNQKMNLTAIKEPQAVLVKHFIDSLSFLKFVPVSPNASIIDVGTGAGFPGIPIKIARPDISLTLLDSLNKRLTFLKEVCGQLNLTAACVHSRAEEGSRIQEFREKFDFVTARAVAPLNILAEYCLPFVRVGGYFVAMKGPDLSTEQKFAQKAINILGGKIQECKSFQLPDGSERRILIVEKIQPTNEKFPRHGSKISKKPL